MDRDTPPLIPLKHSKTCCGWLVRYTVAVTAA
jgi:hypothetical protein